eukprot:COSAG05_NODE_2059_length_3623_cov_31.140062_3_plen_56_part_00
MVDNDVKPLRFAFRSIPRVFFFFFFFFFFYYSNTTYSNTVVLVGSYGTLHVLIVE